MTEHVGIWSEPLCFPQHFGQQPFIFCSKACTLNIRKRDMRYNFFMLMILFLIITPLTFITKKNWHLKCLNDSKVHRQIVWNRRCSFDCNCWSNWMHPTSLFAPFLLPFSRFVPDNWRGNVWDLDQQGKKLFVKQVSLLVMSLCLMRHTHPFMAVNKPPNILIKRRVLWPSRRGLQIWQLCRSNWKRICKF